MIGQNDQKVKYFKPLVTGYELLLAPNSLVVTPHSFLLTAYSLLLTISSAPCSMPHALGYMLYALFRAYPLFLYYYGICVTPTPFKQAVIPMELFR